MAAQFPDIIIVDGVQLKLFSNPLEQYWIVNNKKRPPFHASENCTRGYVATWELTDNTLVLKSIDGNIEKPYFFFWKKLVRYSVDKLFKKAGNRGVRATWVTGKIRIPQGKQILYVHHGYDSRFEQEKVITLERGVAVKSVVLDYTRFRVEANR